MKVLHISYSTSGGAGIAAYRLHKAMQSEGVDSQMLCVKSKIEDASIQVLGYKKPSIASKIRRKLFSTSEEKLIKEVNKLSGKVEVFSTPFSNYEIQNLDVVRQADIINLHWINGLINFPSFFKNITKPIVWTLHDMNPFKGGFHYEFDITNYTEQKLIDIDNFFFNIKKKAYDSSSISAIVTPSNWLSEVSSKSDLFSKYSHIHIHNTAPTDIITIRDKNEVREELQLPLDKTILLFVSQDIKSKRKGFKLLEKTINNYQNDDVLFIAIGKKPERTYDNVMFIGEIKDLEKLAKMYNAADAFLLPSNEDNLPNTMVESLLSGLPVIGSAVGGIADEIIDNENGLLVRDKDFQNSIKQFLSKRDSFNSESIRFNALKKLKEEIVVKTYLDLYKKTLNEA